MRFGYTYQEMEKALAEYLPLWRAGRPYALAIWNEPGVATITAPMRAMIGAWTREHAEHIRRTNLVAAIVMPELSYRAALTALHWLSPPPSPQVACASLIEAVEHCCDALTRNRIPLNSGIHALRDELRRDIGYGGT